LVIQKKARIKNIEKLYEKKIIKAKNFNFKPTKSRARKRKSN